MTAGRDSGTKGAEEGPGLRCHIGQVLRRKCFYDAAIG